ncbi:MAG: hypothetical protein LBN21_06100 [Treponema sp.]|jgi:hypothetical protein|nr:hypothetical protein [Treponema sp.]
MNIQNLKKIGAKRIRLLIIAASVVAAAAVLCIVFWPRPVWYVQADFEREWIRILRQVDPPFTRIKIYDGDIPQKGLGFCITGDIRSWAGQAGTEGNDAVPAAMAFYPRLSDTREYQGARVLALDPWMVFYRHAGLPLTRSRADGPGEGTLILPGADEKAVWAWAAQSLQTQPGVFSAESGAWDAALRDLKNDSRFQPGADAYRWAEALSLLMRAENAWLYAPLSQVRELPSYRMGLLTAQHFPVKSNWNVFGLQADILWAVPVGKTGQSKKQQAWAAWLGDALTQTAIADELRWIPAHPQGAPYNPISRDAQLAWISGSFVWNKHPEL